VAVADGSCAGAAADWARASVVATASSISGRARSAGAQRGWWNRNMVVLSLPRTLLFIFLEMTYVKILSKSRAAAPGDGKLPPARSWRTGTEKGAISRPSGG